MQTKREIDRKVAESLGLSGYMPCNADDCKVCNEKYVRFSTSWEGMGVLVEEALKKGIYISVEPFKSFTLDFDNATSYHKNEYRVQARDENSVVMSSMEDENPLFAACIVFLDSQGVDITSYLGEAA